MGLRVLCIGGKLLGPGHPVFLAAEVGTTCNGDVQTALKLVDAAKDAGADAIKFQLINPDALMSDASVMYGYENAFGKQSENMYEMFKRLRLSNEDWDLIKTQCIRRQIILYTSIDSVEDLTINKYGLRFTPSLKVSSWDLRNYPLLRAVARTGKVVQVDLGPAILGEVVQLIDMFKREGNDRLIFLHCSHTADKDRLNMRTIQYVQNELEYLCGYSSDGIDFEPDLMAVCGGACLIEKRLTLDKYQKQHHHAKALEPEFFACWAERIRGTERVMGDYAIKPAIEDLQMKQDYFTSIVAAIDIAAGVKITGDMLAAKRPGTGISPYYDYCFIGREAVCDIRENELLRWTDV